MDTISIATLITALATVFLAGATFYYAYTNHKLMVTQEKILKKTRKQDEVKLIINPIINQCISEIKNIDEKRFFIIERFETFNDDISKNYYKKMIYEDFILNHASLSEMMGIHDEVIHKIKEYCSSISKIFNEEKISVKN
ncbi:MAG: hypothetical protein NTW30_05735 [Candidatus Aenigmarchaeota archaeon]|nr:hypothetical protein [Candidatus Aenigmarchaeota archaeon]